jgi:hypothetical protein
MPKKNAAAAAVCLVLAVAPVFGQLNCATQVMPVKPVTLCPDTTPLCLCGPTGTNCHWTWVCASWLSTEPPVPQVTNPLGGIVDAYRDTIRIKSERLRAEAEANFRNAQAAALRAQTKRADETADKTAGAYNGRYWVRCPLEVKAGIVVGFNIVIENVVGAISPEIMEKYAVAGTVGEMMKTLDNFYQREDVQIPIWLAVRLIKLNQDGASESEITAALDEFGRRVTPAK